MGARPLFALLMWRFRGGFRRRFQELRTLRGALYFCVCAGLIAFLFWHGLPELIDAELLVNAVSRQSSGWLPLGLLASCVLTVFISSGPAVHFSPAEINLLFSGPFSRASLLIYKLGFYLFGALLSGLLISLLLPPQIANRAAVVVGSSLVLILVQLFSANAGLASQILARKLRRNTNLSWKRWHGLLILAVLITVATSASLAGDGIVHALTSFRESTSGRLLLAPFQVFANVFGADSSTELLAWSALAVTIIGAFIAMLIFLDGRCYEETLAANHDLQERWQRFKRSGSLWSSRPNVKRSASLPPWLKGIGVLAWRQALNALRGSFKPVAVLTAMALVAGPLLATLGEEMSRGARAGTILFIGIFVLPRSLVFDFRSDLSAMEYLKSLPLPAWAVCTGQILVPVLLTSSIEYLMLLAALPVAQHEDLRLLGAVALFIVPANFLLYAIENCFLLLFPTALVPVGRIDFDFFGRTLIALAIKVILIVCASAIAIFAGLFAASVFRNMIPFFITAWVVISLLGLAGIALLSWSFHRFDVSRIPP